MIWNCKNKKTECGKKTLIMGIINVTPDSFSDGGDNFDFEKAAENAVKMQNEGADIIDFGAQSTRPGYTLISANEEWRRLEPVFKEIKGKINIPVSVDTFYPQVAEKAIQNGADIINDVSGIVSKGMAEIIKKTGAGWIIMHNGEGDIQDVKEFFDKSVKEAENFGINKNQICLDMGIGFGKTREQDMSLISNIKLYKKEGFPLLLGTSRKRVIKAGSGQENPKERIYGNIAADTAAIFSGVDIIRIHDVKNEKQGIFMADALKKALK
ncbi:MAG: dihydropteroate synthase [Clostridiales bacterium]|nr:dihydropteroate synthase [Clostridiales bacterium]